MANASVRIVAALYMAALKNSLENGNTNYGEFNVYV